MVSRLSVETEKQCFQCGGAIGPGSREVTVRSTNDGELALVNQDCLDHDFTA